MGFGDMIQNLTNNLIMLLWILGFASAVLSLVLALNAFKSINGGMLGVAAVGFFILSIFILNTARQSENQRKVEDNNVCAEVLGEEFC